jgi:hypothetical protein
MGAHDAYFQKPKIPYDHERPRSHQPPADTAYTNASEKKGRCGYEQKMDQIAGSKMAMQFFRDRTATAALGHTRSQGFFRIQKPHRQLVVTGPFGEFRLYENSCLRSFLRRQSMPFSETRRQLHPVMIPTSFRSDQKSTFSSAPISNTDGTSYGWAPLLHGS